MSLFLASVTSLEEARIALEHGADVIDLKNPAQGALGALPVATIAQVTEFIAGRKLVSATAGDPPMQPDILLNTVTAIAAAGADVVKIGFSASPGYQECMQALQSVTRRGIKLIAVLFADQVIPPYALADFSAAGFYGVMLDTASKNGKGLTDCLATSAIADFVTDGHRLGLFVGWQALCNVPTSHRCPHCNRIIWDSVARFALIGSAPCPIERQRMQNVHHLLRKCRETDWLVAA